jgi:PHD finger-like domain-containing protein 5A
MCRKQAGVSLGILCERCDGKCVICDSYVRPHTLAHLCDECSFGNAVTRCVVCSAPGIEGSNAYYCKECVQQEKDRDGCPKVISVSKAQTARHFDQKKFKVR